MLYVAAFGRGVYKSVDDGHSWKLKNNGIKQSEPFAWRIIRDNREHCTCWWRDAQKMAASGRKKMAPFTSLPTARKLDRGDHARRQQCTERTRD